MLTLLARAFGIYLLAGAAILAERSGGRLRFARICGIFCKNTPFEPKGNEAVLCGWADGPACCRASVASGLSKKERVRTSRYRERTAGLQRWRCLAMPAAVSSAATPTASLCPSTA
jgi:hypothetical protein